MEIEIGPTGNLIKGSVFDWPIKKITKEVQKIEPRLYFKWNPKKNDGYGVWELRIHPTRKTAVDQGWIEGGRLFTLEAVESELVHHIKDFSVLNFSIVEWLREHDTTNDKFWTKNLDYEDERRIDKVDAANDANRRYIAKHYRQEFKQLQELVRSGYDPMGWSYHKPKK